MLNCAFFFRKQVCRISNQLDSTSGPLVQNQFFQPRTVFSVMDAHRTVWESATVQVNFNTKAASKFLFRIFFNSINPLFGCDATRSQTSSHPSLSLVTIYEFMSFSVSMIYLCILRSTKSACLHSQTRYATVIWGKGWHIGEIPSARGKKRWWYTLLWCRKGFRLYAIQQLTCNFSSLLTCSKSN